MQNEHPYRSKIFHDNLRYSALNLSAVKKFGSMEFRLFPAVSVPDNLDVWIDSLNNIRLYSLKFNTLSALKKELVDVPVEKVIQDMLGDDCLQYILKKIRRKLSDNELLGWSRGAFCNICTILDTEIKIPSEKELKKLFDAAEADDVKIKAKLKLNPVKAPVQRNTYAVISHNFNYDDNDQLDQADLRIETNSGAVADE